MNNPHASEGAQSFVAPHVAAVTNDTAALPLEKKASPGRRALRILAIAGSLAVASALFLRKEDQSLLCGGLVETDAQRVCQALDAIGIRYTLGDNGSAVYVPKHQVHSARLALVRKSVAQGGLPTFDIIEVKGSPRKSSVYNAALEEELSATIAAMEGVESVRVLIEIPGNRGRLEGKLPFAVIVVHASGATKLSNEQVQIIQRLVASSTDVLTADQVVVLQSPDDRILAQSKS